MADDRNQRSSVGAPAPSATARVAEGTGGPPEEEAGEPGLDHAPAEEEREAEASVPERDAEASVPAGEPEAPVAPAAAEATSEPDDHETKLEHDLEELTAKAQKADEYLELAKRTRADFENYRKRSAREAAAAQERGVIKLVRELLPAVDNLDRALEAVEADASKDGDELVSGLKLVHAEVVAALARAGVERFSPQGERFDPERHEAVAQQPSEESEPGTVIEVYQRGYRLGDTVIRPARVVVAG